MVTNITDRFGKTINFTYQDGLISKISSSDGSEVNFAYNANYDISSITANGRVWNYTYSGVALTGVTLPDGKSWSFNLAEMLATPSSYQPTVSGTITHPYGAVGSFTAQRTKHGRSLVPAYKNVSGKYILNKDEYHNSLTSKNISGPGLPSMAWSYVYSANDGAYAGTATSDIKTVHIYDPEGNSEKYHFYRSFDWREGKIFKKEVFQAATLKGTEVSTWSKGNKIGRVSGDNILSAGKDDYRTNLSQRLISRGTDSFTTDFSSYDVWGNPGAYTEYSNLNSTRKYYSQTYFNDLAKWLIGFPLETKLSSDNINYQSLNRTAYYAASHAFASLPQYEYKSGRLFRTYTSYFISGTSSGMPNRITFNDGRGYVEIGAYKNTVPTLITRPTSDGLSTEQASLSVDANGWVTSYTDYNGNYTTFDYNPLGWRTLVDPGDSKWNSTSISYAPVSGYLTRTISKGNYRKLEKFDAFLRTIQSEEYDITNIAGKIVRYFEYDSNGNLTFEGFPLLGSYSYGLMKSYDALGRVTSVLDNSNNAETRYSYLNGHTVSITDPKGYSTSIAYLSFGSPDYQSVASITAPENVQTILSYDIRGNLISVTQGGITERRVYNTYQDLCKIIRPDVGNTGFFYNSFGQIQWKASGSSIDSVTTACDTLADAPQKETYSFDSRGNLKTVVFSDSNLNRSFGYDANDNLISASSGAVSKTTSYDSLNQVINQKLTVDGREFNLVYGYDANANLSSLTYPDGEVVNYQPNALGQPTQVGAYVTNTSYHQTGAVKGFSYGNSFVRSTIVQNNGLLSRVTDNRSTVSALDQGLIYDLNSNISQLTDHVSSINSLVLTYDSLDRLKTFTSSSIGAGSVSYDTLSNITSLKHGSEILNYNYSSNRLSSVTGSKNYSYSYDSQGNVANNGLYSLTFNAAGQLEYAKGNSYQYDASNIRVRSIEAQGVSYFVHGVDGKLVYRDKQGVVEKYYYLNGSQVAKTSNSTISYAHTNYLGSPEAHSNTSGAVTSRTYYRPFGATIGLTADDVGYTGHKYDAELGLTYMQQRYYDPVIGRFYSNDPVGFTASNPMMFNRYAYANNNPYKYTDPDGRSALVLEGIKDGAIIGGSAGGPWGAAGGAIVGGLIGAGATYGIIQLANESSNDVDDFVDDLKDKSEPDKNSGKGKIRTLTDGTSVDEAFDSFPGKEGEASDGSKIKTASDGSTAHIHNSSKDNGRKTLNIKRPNEKKPTKFREPEKKND